MSVMRVIVLHSYTNFEVGIRYSRLSVTALSSQVISTFGLSISNWGHASPVSWVSLLLAIYALPFST